MAQAALKHMKDGAAIINTTSITAYRRVCVCKHGKSGGGGD